MNHNLYVNKSLKILGKNHRLNKRWIKDIGHIEITNLGSKPKLTWKGVLENIIWELGSEISGGFVVFADGNHHDLQEFNLVR